MSHSVTRREFVAAAVGFGVAAVSRSEAKEPAVNDSIPIIDTHQHLWDLNRLHLPWFDSKESQPLKRSFLPADYDAATAGAPIVKTVYMEVNCDPQQQKIEADYVIGLCRDPNGRMRGAVIGGTMPSDRFAGYIKEYAQNPYVKGVRMVLHDADRPKGMCLERQFVENVQLLGELGLSFDLCMRPAELIDGVRLMEKCPRTRFVVDHCGNGNVQADAKQRAAWEKGIKAAAAQERAICKISGIVVTARPEVWKPADLESTVNFCLDAFGPDRVVFGGDWPVCTLRATYRQWLDALRGIVRDRPAEFRRKLFHDNADKFYKLS